MQLGNEGDDRSNVEDRRGFQVGGIHLGIGGLIVVGVLSLVFRTNLFSAIDQGQGAAPVEQTGPQVDQRKAAEQGLEKIAVGSFNDVQKAWSQTLPRYHDAKLVLFHRLDDLLDLLRSRRDDTVRNGGVSSVHAFQDRIVVLNLWASWCPPCRAEMPDLERFSLAYRRRGVVVVGVDEGESAARAAAFARSLAITYPILIDETQEYGRVYAALGLPTTAIISRDGVVVRTFDGPLTYRQMGAAVASLIPSH